jgi:uncharacterized protein
MIFQRSNPSKELFNQMESLCEVLVSSSEYLKKRSVNKHKPAYSDFIHDQEKKADAIVRSITDITVKSFILPLDKEDITHLVDILDTIIDNLERVENRLNIYHLPISDAVADFSKVLVDCSHNIHIAFRELALNHLTSSEFLTCCENLNSLEKKGDLIHRKHLETLMNDEKTKPLTIIKWREIYQTMEDTLNQCEVLAITFEQIRIKYT